MSRYIEEETVIKAIDESGQRYGITTANQCNFKEILRKTPTADVVPKSEVDWHREAELNAQRIIELEAEVDRLKKDNEYILMQHRFQRRPSGDCWNDVIEKAKADVAREIFEEIEKLIEPNDKWLWQWDLNKLAELKKKYTEDGK